MHSAEVARVYLSVVWKQDINETLVLEMALALRSSGLAQLGYNHIHIDAGWLNKQRGSHGQLVVNTSKFPSGMAALSAELRKQGLRLGLYTDLGNTSCGTGPGSYGHYKQDAETFADIGADALKVDFCDFWFMGAPPDYSAQLALWKEFADALNATGRPMWLYISPHSHVPDSGVSAPWSDAHPYAPPLAWNASTRASIANSLMTQYVNMFDTWYTPHWLDAWLPGRCQTPPFDPKCGTSPPGGFVTNVDALVALSRPEYSGPGTWTDAQQLLVCNFGRGAAGGTLPGAPGMTLEEYRAQYSIWAILASPLVLSADLRTIATDHPSCLAMISNPEVIEINQDSLGKAGVLLRQRQNDSSGTESSARSTNIVEQTWAKQLAGGDIAVLFFNRAEHVATLSVSWGELGLRSPERPRIVRDVWGANSHGVDLGNYSDGFNATVLPHAVRFVRIRRLH